MNVFQFNLIILLFICLFNFLNCKINKNLCYERKKMNLNYDIIKNQLELNWKEGYNNVTILFGHVHHAGGTVVCSLVQSLYPSNKDNNCHHPDEFDRYKLPPTRGNKQIQLKFQRKTPWRFYSVEKMLPRELIFYGPFIYMIILRHPYILTISNYLRQKSLKGYTGSLTDYLKGDILSLGYYFNTYHSLFEFLAIEGNHFNQDKSKMYLEAFRKLEKFSVILLTDDLAQTSQLLKIKFGWNTTGLDIPISPNMLPIDQIHRNSQGPQERLLQYLSNLTISEKKLFRETLKDDLVIFRYARCLVDWEFNRLNLTSLPTYESKFKHIEDILK